MTLGQKIRNARIECGLTQKQLVGEHITRNMLSKIENDSATPSVRTLEYIASRLHLPTSYFMNDAKYSDGTSMDGLDDMRKAYKEGRYTDCIRLLEESRTAGTTDEGYLLHSLAALAQAHAEITNGDYAAAKEYADAADYYNHEGMYYSPSIDAEMSLILAECALTLDISEFEENAREYERAIQTISFQDRYNTARAEFLIRTGEHELAQKILEKTENGDAPRTMYLKGACILGLGDVDGALRILQAAESAAEDEKLLKDIYAKLEEGYLKADDYKMAYLYAAKQLRGNGEETGEN